MRKEKIKGSVNLYKSTGQIHDVNLNLKTAEKAIKFLLSLTAVILIFGFSLGTIVSANLAKMSAVMNAGSRLPIHGFTAAQETADVFVFYNQKVRIDFTDANTTGTVKISAVSEFDKKIKVTIKKNIKNETVYTYDLKNDTTAELYPLQMGSGEYIIKVWFQIEDNQYGLGFICKYTVALSDEFAPFLHPNQYVNYNKNSKIAQTAAKLTKNCASDIEKLEAIYEFVVKNLSYDVQKEEEARKGNMRGYLPVIDSILEEGKGICFDYAAVLAAMLRSQNIPAKLVIGQISPVSSSSYAYAYSSSSSSKNTLHAWNEVYIRGQDEPFVINTMKFDGKDFERLDPTFDSNSKSDKTMLEYIGNSSNYTKLHEY